MLCEGRIDVSDEADMEVFVQAVPLVREPLAELVHLVGRPPDLVVVTQPGAFQGAVDRVQRQQSVQQQVLRRAIEQHLGPGNGDLFGRGVPGHLGERAAQDPGQLGDQVLGPRAADVFCYKISGDSLSALHFLSPDDLGVLCTMLFNFSRIRLDTSFTAPFRNSRHWYSHASFRTSRTRLPPES